jgi:hypothetical protein
MTDALKTGAAQIGAFGPTFLRPMFLGEILDRTAQLYRRRFLLFVGVAAGPSVVVLACLAAGFLLIALTRGKATDPAAMALLGLGSFALLMVGLPLYAAASGLGYAALSDAANKRLFDEPVTIRGAYREAWRRGWRYLGLFALEFLILGIVPVAVILFGIIGLGLFLKATGTSSGEAHAATALALIAMFAVLGGYVLWMLPRLSLAFPVCVVEKAGVWKSLKRGYDLSQGTRWRILLLFVLGSVSASMLNWAVTIPVVIVVALIPGMSSPHNSDLLGSIMLFATYGASFAVQALVRPVYGIGLTLFYYDQRVRKEGFDIEWMMQRAGLTGIAELTGTPAPTGPVQPRPGIAPGNTVQDSGPNSALNAAPHSASGGTA